MNKRLGILLGVGCVIVAVILGGVFFSDPTAIKEKYQIWKFEGRLKQTVDPAALREWAAKLVQEHPVDSAIPYEDRAGTNLAPGLEKLYDSRPRVAVGGKSSSPVVTVYWREQPSLHVGTTNFKSTAAQAKLWQPGIYIIPPY